MAKKGCIQRKVSHVMREAAHGTLHSGSGGIVKAGSKQAKAIAYSEARKKCYGGGRRKKK